MSTASDDLEIQGAWDPDPLRAQWPLGLDNYFIMKRLMEVPVEQTLFGASGRVLEVAAAEAVHSCRLAAQGLECHVVEPSEGMLARAREHMATHGVHLNLVRGIAEALPYPDRHFDRVLIDSAMDHLAAPDTGLREMVRVLKPDGRFIVSFVNYGSLAVRLSRAVYGVERRLLPAAREARRFWDSPVPYEHTFECTYRNIGALCGQYLELDRVVGVSLLWGAPGWARLLGNLTRVRAERLLERLDGVARRLPGLADFVLMVWRPRAAGETPGTGLRALGPLARLTAATPAPPPRRLESLRVTPADPVYLARAAEDCAWEERWRLAPVFTQRLAAEAAMTNRARTGDPRRSAIDAFAARGPFDRVALLAGDGEDEAEAWLRAGGSRTLDVFEASAARLTRLRGRLAGYGERLRLLQQDLNFLTLPGQHYDAVLAGSGVFRLLNLEYVFDEIAQALRPGGLFGLLSYIGERRQAYAPARLALVNAALAEVPARFRFDAGKGIEAADPAAIAPFRAVRSDEILAVARARFEVVEEQLDGRLFPLFLYLDVAALERQEPALLERLLQRERALAADPAATPCTAFLVLRRR